MSAPTVAAVCAIVALAAGDGAAEQTYRRASVDPSGRLRIVTSSGREIIPRKVVVLTRGTERTFTGDGLPIWRWSFSAGGARVAYLQAPVHGPAPEHFELRHLRIGRLVGSFDADSSRAPPSWVRALAPPR